VGLLCRVALAVVTEHVMDTNVYLLSARAWFQYGNPQGSYGPTLPLTFFLYWIPYAPYALLQNLGFQDPHFFAHSAGIVESVFIRLLPMSGDVLTFIALLHFKPSARSFVFSAFYFLNPLVIFMSSVWGQYASVTMALIVIGTYFLNAKKIGRAGAAFVAAGAIELLGFIPYILVLVATARAKKITTLVGLACLILPILAYSSEANQIFRLVLSITGANGTLPLGRTNQYTLLGSFTELSFVSSLHPLLAAGTVVSLGVVYDSYKQKLDARRVLLYTILSALAFLIFSSLLTAWLWLVPAGILYAIMTEREMLGAFTLILGTATSFLMASNTMSYAYLLFDNAGLTVLPAIEFVRNRLPLFSVMVSLLAIIYALYLHKTVGTAQGTLIRMSIVTLGLYLLFYFWLGVYSV